jgi:hypothetical protein
MITYKLNLTGDFAQEFLDNIATGNWANTKTNEAYLAWVALGNQPQPADEVTQ